jgi:tetratricopeptide (TPR) repeat protein
MGDERWDEAVVALRRFLETIGESQDHWTVYRNLGACYLALERYDDALSALDEAERLAPDDPDTLHSRGVTLACAGRASEAIAAFERFAHRWPKVAHQHETREALRLLRRIQNGEAPARTYLVNHLQEQVGHNVEMGDWHLIERKGRRMIAADPDRPEGHLSLGVACIEQERHQEALEALLVAQSHDPDDAPTLYNIGHAYFQLDQPEQAIPWLERAVRQDAKHLPALYQMGVACERMGQREEAVDWWRRALRADPHHYPAQERLHEVGQGPEPREPPLPPARQQMLTMAPVVKARMKHPQVHRNGDVTLTWDGQVGFLLEDSENPRNYSIYAGGPFQAARIRDKDLLDLMGLVKLLLHMINVENTREVAVLVYYDERPVFSYQARFERGEQIEFDAGGQFIVSEVPRLFKLRIDSDLSTPYGDPMQGVLIYLSRHPKPGRLISTLGLGAG